MKKWLPWIIVALFAAWVVGTLFEPSDKDFSYVLFGRIPVVANGRVQPLDSLARNTLLQLREKQSANLEPWKSNPRMMSATEWLLNVMTKPDEADRWPEFRIDNPDLKSLLGLPAEPDVSRAMDGKHFSWAQIQPKLDELTKEAERAQKSKEAGQNPGPYDQAVLQLWNAQTLYNQLKSALGPASRGELLADIGPYFDKIRAGFAANDARKDNKAFEVSDLIWLNQQFDTPLVIPPPAGQPAVKWSHTVEAVMAVGPMAAMPDPALVSLNDIAKASRANDPHAFNAAVAGYLQSLRDRGLTKAVTKARSEQYFNFIEPFYTAMVIYVCAFLLVLVYWFRPGNWDWLRRAAVGMVVLALIVHTVGLVFRMALEGRPPVTNLYSSAIFIGWGATILGLILEKFWRNSIGIMVSCIIGFLTLIIAHHLRLGGDTMEMMVAVLDTNFWLATHVVVVTLGYASTFVAGVLGIIYIIAGVFTPALTNPMSRKAAQLTGVAVAAAGVKTDGSRARTALNVAEAAERGELGRSLNRMIYGIICFATLFSFVGTVLGGIWADQSWGRFWGWDPKENGALIIVLWNALVLHARWGGLVRERGLAVMAVVGNIVTSWSWFGVNMLGIGLHSYGFTSAAFRWLVIFVATQLTLVALGLLPKPLWRSFQAPQRALSGKVAPAAA